LQIFPACSSRSTVGLSSVAERSVAAGLWPDGGRIIVLKKASLNGDEAMKLSRISLPALAALLSFFATHISCQSKHAAEEFAQAKALLLDVTMKGDSAAIVQARQRFERLLQDEQITGNDSLAAWAHYYIGLDDWLLTFVSPGNQEGQKKLMDDALAHLESAIKLKTNLVDAYAVKRRCLYWRYFLDRGTAKAFVSESQAALQKAKALAPENPLVILEEAVDLFYKPAAAGGNQQQGLARFQEAIEGFEQQPKKDRIESRWWRAMACMMLGQAYLGVEKPEDAERAFKAALALEPHFEMVKNGMLPMTQLVTLPPMRSFDGVTWTTLATDSANDGRNPNWADVKALLLYYDASADTLWLKFELSRLPNPNVFGINLVIDADGDRQNGANWWGGNKSFKYDKLASIWVVKVGENSYRGTVGIADVDGIQRNRYTNLFQNNLVFRADGEKKTMIVGVKSAELDEDGNINLIAAVGSNVGWNDDITDASSIAIKVSR
jgi:tetratricopeptide (TPR) repeat protein